MMDLDLLLRLVFIIRPNFIVFLKPEFGMFERKFNIEKKIRQSRPLSRCSTVFSVPVNIERGGGDNVYCRWEVAREKLL